jgi:imidazolonepropionase-like amidohydrolase
MPNIIFTNARVFDGSSDHCAQGMTVWVEDGLIKEVSDRSLKSANTPVIDVGGRTLMPGLIDAHIHAYSSDVNIQKVDTAGDAYRTAHAVRMLGHALDCGFTTVRDVGGGDYSLWRAIEDGLIRAPRFFYSGKIISMTGGHGDFRPMSLDSGHGLCACGQHNCLSVVADGVEECIRATREQLRRGAHCIKIMGSGGVASPTDPIWMNQYREDEIRAVVNEAVERRTYVSAHCHPANAIRRCVEFGVRVIEHGTLVDDETCRYVAEQGAYIVPTMAIIFALIEVGPQLGFPRSSQDKVQVAFRQALSGMESMRRAGVKIGFGTDLLGATYTHQAREFNIRREVFAPLEILRQATSINASILMKDGKLGCISPGAHADLLVVDGDPLRDIGLLGADGAHLKVIMRGGEWVKNELPS